jgi:type II secretory pathway pseudopilin PulG
MKMRAVPSGGFTLIELMLVIVIIIIISSVAIVAVAGVVNKTKINRVHSELRDFVNIVQLAELETGSNLMDITGRTHTAGSCYFGGSLAYTTSSCYGDWVSSLNLIINAAHGQWQNGLLRDPWGSPYLLDENQGESGWWGPCQPPDVIFSAGPDTLPETADDIYLDLPITNPC